MKQEKALAILKSGSNVFLTGSAGTGKTYVLNQYIQYLKEHKIPVAVTASTGIAATHLNGLTIHSWSGMGVKDQLSLADLKKMKEKKYLLKSIENTKVLIIDEISMLHRKQLELVHEILQYFKNSLEAFGGIQLILCGDFFQLPPVTHRNEENKEKFAFMSPAWVKAQLTICYLTDQYRQTLNDLNTILNEIRTGEVSHRSLDLLESTKDNELGDLPTRLFTHNADVDTLNFSQLKALEGKETVYKARKKGNPKLLETLKKSVLTYETLPLKIGAKVMFVKNNYEQGYMNGTMGDVVAFTEDDNLPLVKITDGRVITAEDQVWSVDDETGKPLATFTQIPLRLAWAITVHKSQGMTLDAAQIDLGKTFEKGQGYVALSRLRDLEGLKLEALNLRALEVDSLVLRADKRFRELSDDYDNQMDISLLQSTFDSFINKVGGSIEKVAIEKQKPKKKVGETYEVTKDLILRGMTIDKMAKERGLSPNTIAGHLLKIKEMFPEVDLSAYKPEQDIIDKVFVALESLKRQNNPDLWGKDGAIKLGILFASLDGEYSYDQLKLAMLYVN